MFQIAAPKLTSLDLCRGKIRVLKVRIFENAIDKSSIFEVRILQIGRSEVNVFYFCVFKSSIFEIGLRKVNIKQFRFVEARFGKNRKYERDSIQANAVEIIGLKINTILNVAA